jgi:hypothetical protein
MLPPPDHLAPVTTVNLPIASPRPPPRGNYVGVAGGRVPLKAYVGAWKRVRNTPPGVTFSNSLCSFGISTREEILREFTAGVADRINQHIPGFSQGRKWDDDWDRTIRFAARELNNPRLRIRWLPPELRSRFAARLATDD